MDSLTRIVLLLAGSDMSQRQILNVIRQIKQCNETELLIAVDYAKKGLGNFAVPERNFRQKLGGRGSQENDDLSNTTREIEHMLVDEAGLTRKEAAFRIIQALPSEYRNSVPNLGRESFRIWVKKLNKIVPDSVLLHVANKIMRRYTNRGRENDWPLKGENDD